MSDPALNLPRLSRLTLYRQWFEETVYERADVLSLYPVGDGELPRLRVPVAGIITTRHLGLEIKQPPTFRLADAGAERWLARILKINGLPGSMRAAATLKSWAGDVGVLFAWRPSERADFGTPWQVSFIPPETYDVAERHPSGVFRAVDVYTFEDRPDPNRRGQLRRWWTRTRYTRELVTTWPEVEGSLDSGVRPDNQAFETAAQGEQQPTAVTNTLGVIPFALIQNVTTGVQDWEGQSDYSLRTNLFHRLNVHLDNVEQGDQIRNRLMMALIDAEDVDVEQGGGMSVLRVTSKEDGTTDRAAQLISTPLLNGGTDQLELFTKLLDLTMESAGVAQSGSAREVFGNEAASSSALQTFYSAQTAVAMHKRANWLGERADYGLSALVRKLLRAASRVDRNSPVFGMGDELDDERFDLTLAWPPMFEPSAPERQTLASVAQQANDDGLPPDLIADVWAHALGTPGLNAAKKIAAALKKRQEQADLTAAPLRASGENATRGILGSGQGDGQNPDGGSANPTVTPE